ncbi:MAG TPA: polyprenyl synthetase family protein [Bacteroidales bacterium]|nr:polyprenyl synthetase family protein [Bacteroidales bacterium]HSA42194.1 polyprenyl synthetase family protein [Bacteroidales bacterium]
MANSLESIQAPVRDHIIAFESGFRQALQSKVSLLDLIMRFVVKRKGKQIRPLFVFLSAGICGEIKDPTYRGAMMIEMLHTATLIHDDVVDDSNERRGYFSLNALWKNKISVLIGDYLLSKGLLIALDHDDFSLLKIVSEATRQMSEGELLQIEKSRFLDIKEEVYFDIIRKKTASLIASCTAVGAESVKATAEVVRKMHDFGENVGIAFQIRDDLFDYGDGHAIGKPRGIDIKEKKLTLPLIYLLRNVNAQEKRHLIHLVRRHHNDPEKVREIIEKVNHSGGIDYARLKMAEYRDKALEILGTFPSGEMRDSLENLVIFTTERSK